VIGTLGSAHAVDGLHFLEVISINVGFECLRRITQFKQLADVTGIEPGLASSIHVHAQGVRFKFKRD
jgi:hypothetical protein